MNNQLIISKIKFLNEETIQGLVVQKNFETLIWIHLRGNPNLKETLERYFLHDRANSLELLSHKISPFAVMDGSLDGWSQPEPKGE